MAVEEASAARGLLSELEARGVVLWSDRGTLRFRAPAGMLTERDRARLSHLKPVILELLERPRPYPASFAQERLWFLWRFDPRSTAFNEIEALRIDGPLDRVALAGALSEIVRRQAVLRTVLRRVDGALRQVILPPAPVEVEQLDLGTLAASEVEAEVTRLARERGRRPFDLAEGPLIRFCLIRLGPEQHRLLFFQHHAVTDRQSSAVFERELAAVYEARSSGRPSELPEPSLPYAEWARRERERDVDEAALGWWCHRLESLTETDLPLDRPRPGVPRREGAWHRLTVDRDLAERLRRRARDETATPFMVCLTALVAALRQWTGRDHVTVGTTASLRDAGEVEGTMGPFVNNLVLRVDASGDPSFSGLLSRARGVCLEAYAHADVPFQSVIARLNPKRDSRRHPLFQVALVVRDYPRPFASGALRMRRVPVDLGTSKYDLAWFVDGGADGTYECTLEYATELFDASTAERHGADFFSILASGLQDPSAPISRLGVVRATS